MKRAEELEKIDELLNAYPFTNNSEEVPIIRQNIM